MSSFESLSQGRDKMVGTEARASRKELCFSFRDKLGIKTNHLKWLSLRSDLTGLTLIDTDHTTTLMESPKRHVPVKIPELGLCATQIMQAKHCAIRSADIRQEDKLFHCINRSVPLRIQLRGGLYPRQGVRVPGPQWVRQSNNGQQDLFSRKKTPARQSPGQVEQRCTFSKCSFSPFRIHCTHEAQNNTQVSSSLCGAEKACYDSPSPIPCLCV